MDLNVIKEPLPIVENPGLETTDPRLEEVSALVQRAQYMEAAELAESVLAEGIKDIRMIGFLCYGVFLERGIGSLKEILDCLAGVLRDSWQALGPAVKKEKHAQTSLRWFSNQLLKKLQYEENAKSELYERWVSEARSEEIVAVIDAADELKRVAMLVLEDAAAPLTDALAKLVQWLKAFQQVIYRDEEPETVEAAPEPEPADAVEEDAAAPAARPAVQQARQAPGGTPASQEGLIVEGSHHLSALMRKIEAFERPIAEGKYPRAALVAEDIGECIASFDPRLYFPKLFARYAYLKAAHFQDLYAFDDQRETPEWQALKEFYRVDLDGFIES